MCACHRSHCFREECGRTPVAAYQMSMGSKRHLMRHTTEIGLERWQSLDEAAWRLIVGRLRGRSEKPDARRPKSASAGSHLWGKGPFPARWRGPWSPDYAVRYRQEPYSLLDRRGPKSENHSRCHAEPRIGSPEPYRLDP